MFVLSPCQDVAMVNVQTIALVIPYGRLLPRTSEITIVGIHPSSFPTTTLLDSPRPQTACRTRPVAMPECTCP